MLPHDHHRLDDDGGPPLPEEHPGHYLISDPRARYWDSYREWRKTKCPQRNLSVPAERIEEITHGTLELVGECAELAQLLSRHSVATFQDITLKSKLIDECGDILFCGIWAMEAWGDCPLHGDIRLAPMMPSNTNPVGVKNIAAMILQNEAPSDEVVKDVMMLIMATTVAICEFSGLTADAAKKERYQARPRDAKLQIDRILHVFEHVGLILALASSSVEAALKANVTKLDARYPGVSGSNGSGGIRTGLGAGA